MRTATVVVLLVSFMAAYTPHSALAAGSECPWQPVSDKPSKDIAKLLPSGAALGDSAEIDATVSMLRGHDLSSGTILDSVISAYCPVVADNSGLTNAQKATAIKNYAARVAKIVYAYAEPDQIILSIPLPPYVVSAAQSKATSAGISVEEWVAGTVEHAVTGKGSP